MQLIILAATILFIATSASPTTLKCHCQPSMPCWPSANEWKGLNSSLGGNLIALRPVGSPCHDPTYDETICTTLRLSSNNSAFLSNQPGALQWENWAASPKLNESCYFETDRSVPCGQGRIPLYSAEVESVADIQAAVLFADKYNIKVVIRNTGHDFLGKSSAPNSLQINTHKLTSMAYVENFVPSIPDYATAPPGIKAAVFGGGVQMHQMYAFLGANGVMVAGGSSSTVGVAGGYLQGGGHGLMGYIAGMGSDNALEFNVVTANGCLVTANAYQNTELFWALRGGGGGSWGVVVNATVKTYPDYPVTSVTVKFTMESPSAAFWSGVEVCNKYIVSLNDAGATGYYYVTPRHPLTANFSIAVFDLYLFFVNQTSTAVINQTVTPMLVAMTNATGVQLTTRITAVQSMSILYAYIFTGADDDGYLVLLGSRLLSRNFIASASSSATITRAMSQIEFGPDDQVQGLIVAGGQVTANAGSIDSALLPAWRSAGLHLLFTHLWKPEMTFTQQEAIAERITKVEIPILKSLEEGPMYAYLSEADAHQRSFQKVFWGSNYQRLYGIKQAVDPQGLFITRKGVGSEHWTDDGACRR